MFAERNRVQDLAILLVYYEWCLRFLYMGRAMPALAESAVLTLGGKVQYPEEVSRHCLGSGAASGVCRCG